MTSEYIANQRETMKKLEESYAQIQLIGQQCAGLSESELPPESLMNVIGSHDAQHFKNVMISLFGEITHRCYIHPDMNILDLGCGCGRIAIPFSRYLKGGKYYGVDVWKEGIEWCQQHITPKSPNSTFVKVDARNNYYFEERNSEANAFALPSIQTGTIDVAFAISTFTHLVKNDCRAYLREFRRILRKDGLAYVTSFIIDDFFHGYVARTGKHTAVREEEPGCYYAYAGQDFFAGYTQATWRAMFDEAELEIISFEPGRWADKPGGRMYQDTFVAIRR